MARYQSIRIKRIRRKRRKNALVLAGVCAAFIFFGILKNTGLANNSIMTDGEKREYIQANHDLFPEALLADLERNDELLDFAVSYPAAEHKVQGKLTREERREHCPLLLQWDSRWGYVDYGSSVIGITGCGPTCLSMVIVGLTGNADATPDYLANEAEEKGYYIAGQGTAWSFLTDEAQNYGLQVSQYSEVGESELRTALDEGNLVISSMKPGDFTDQGHFIVICDYTPEGFVVHDPFSRNNSDCFWGYETLESQWKQLWIYSNA